MSAPLRAAALALSLLSAVLASAALVRPARASTEEFSTFDVLRPEEDDESLLDHLLTAAPRAWDDEWRRAPMAVRTAQGCLTSGQWLNETQLRVRAPMGERARFGVLLDQSETDFASWNQLDFVFEFPLPFGTPGVSFRPFYDKSRQDFALSFETDADTAQFFARGVFTFEDMFNNLWAWRQTRVGNVSEPYERHPYEPALRIGGRGERWSAEISGKWLTPSRRREPAPIAPQTQRTTLWGTLGEAKVEVDAAGLRWEATALDKQAESTAKAFLDPLGGPYTGADSAAVYPYDRHKFRRVWRTGLSARRIEERWTAEVRWLYQDRHQNDPWFTGTFHALDRLIGAEYTRELLPERLDLRLGGLYDRIRVVANGVATPREETRLYFGLDARFGNVRVFGVEGIELDDEPYEVWFVHDKGFLGLQATF